MLDDFDISSFGMDDFPFEGAFYTYEIDNSLPLDKRVPKEVLVEEVRCDIQKNSRMHNGVMLGADYCVYWAMEDNPESTYSNDKYMPIKVRRGMHFRGIMYGYVVEGVVEIVRASQLGGCSADIKITTESEY